MAGRGMKRVRKVLYNLSLVGSVVLLTYPIINMALQGLEIEMSSFFAGRGTIYIGGIPLNGGIFRPSLATLQDAFALYAYPRLAFNSTVIALLSIAIGLAVSLPAAYFLARSKLRGKAVLSYFILALRTASPFTIILPLYLFYTRNGLWNTYYGMALAYLVLDLPVMVWMLKSFFTDIPSEVYEAAEVSGASESQIFWKVALPTIVVGIVATVIFAFVLLWNEFLMADLLTGGATKTVSVGVWTGAGENIAVFRSVDPDVVNILGALSFIPAFAIIVVIKRYLARGFSLATAR
jgi:multiple sugar transport system permease protein